MWFSLPGFVKMTDNSVPALFITANVGSIFEEPNVMLKLWTEEFLSTVSMLEPKFLALHCQEVGGKNYEQSMKHVEYFVRLLITSEELRLFDRMRIYLDEDFSSAENFTALGNFYFIHKSVPDILIWDFKELHFVDVGAKEIYAGNIEDISTKEKSKFPQNFFSECKWSRKGFLRTRWNLNGTIFDLVNIHLFHDASNIIAMETFPSVYSLTRQRALEYTLDRFHTDEFGSAPFFLFGDLNFRTDMQAVIKKLSTGLNPLEITSAKNGNEITKLMFRDKEGQVVLTLGKKEFSHCDHQNIFIENSGEWLREFDKELDHFAGQLYEMPIHFPPSYPYEEDTAVGRQYMQTRCPAWCDRVILSETAKHLVYKMNEHGSTEYGSIGENTCMGDHKPVYLRLRLIGEAGRIVCCDNRPLPHASPVTPLSTMDSSNSIKLKDRECFKNSVGDVSVNFLVGAEHEEGGKGPPRKEKFSFSRLSSEGNIGVNVDLKSSVFKFRENSQVSEIGETKGYDRYIVKRVHSASIVEVPRVGMVKTGGCRCPSESQSWRARSASISSRGNTWKTNSRIRLISESNLQSSLLRLQSHHSSSDEEWFEEIDHNDSCDNLFIMNKGNNNLYHNTFTLSKVPVLEEVSLEGPYGPARSVEDVSLGSLKVLQSGMKSNYCCPLMQCRRKRKYTRSQRDCLKSNSLRYKNKGDSVPVDDKRCCCIS